MNESLSMRMRLAKVDEYQFVLCLKHSLWGSKSSRFRDWREGDYLTFIADKGLTALSVISGRPFYSTDIVSGTKASIPTAFP